MPLFAVLTSVLLLRLGTGFFLFLMTGILRKVLHLEAGAGLLDLVLLLLVVVVLVLLLLLLISTGFASKGFIGSRVSL